MRILTIVRHAKAEQPEAYPVDADRPLTKRGHKDAVKLAAILNSLKPPVGWIISSPALRTRQTTEHIVDSLHFAKPVIWEETIYRGYADTLLMALTSVPPEAQHVLLVGHNPGVEELVSGLCAGAQTRLNLAMSPASLAHIQLEIFWWNQIRWGCGQLEMLVRPKSIAMK